MPLKHIAHRPHTGWTYDNPQHFHFWASRRHTLPTHRLSHAWR
jgi:hypothetical protein